MSTREIALDIFNQLDEDELNRFVTIFGKIPLDNDETSTKIDLGEVDEKKAAALDRIEQLTKKIAPYPSDFDEKAEYLKYLDERYGI